MILKKAKLWRRVADDYKPLKTKASDIGRALTRDELRPLARNNKDFMAAFYGSVVPIGGQKRRTNLACLCYCLLTEIESVPRPNCAMIRRFIKRITLQKK